MSATAGAVLRAPAKINLGLRITGRRSDGYHEIESLFLPLDLADEIELSVESDVSAAVTLRVEGPAEALGPADANLAARAARGFLGAAGLRAAIHLVLRKRIPVGAGLGGGSSDAGTVLRALAARWPGALAAPRLSALALELGADVPFFLDPRPARVSGIGERIEPLGAFSPLWLLLATPRQRLSTAAVFADYARGAGALTPERPGRTMLALPAFRAREGPHRIDALAPPLLEELLRNDLEPAATRLCPEIGGLRERMRKAGARAVGMSGSGPTVFGIFADAAGAERARKALADEDGAAAADLNVSRAAETE